MAKAKVAAELRKWLKRDIRETTFVSVANHKRKATFVSVASHEREQSEQKIMALIVPVRGFTPQIGKDCFLAENATIVGDTVIGEGCSIWFNAVLRGDVNWIKIGNHVNIQDGSVLHTLYEKSTITIGDYVSVGHNVTIHGADVHDYALIGMGSTLLDGVVVGEGAIVAAGSLVLKNTQIGPYEVWGGVPAKFIKKADPEQTNEINRKIAHNYAMYASWYMEEEK